MQEKRRIYRQTVDTRMAGPFSVYRQDGAITLFHGDFETEAEYFPRALPPAVVVVRPDQFTRALAFCQALADVGVRQMCWLPHELDLGIRWAQIENECRPRAA